MEELDLDLLQDSLEELLEALSLIPAPPPPEEEWVWDLDEEDSLEELLELLQELS